MRSCILTTVVHRRVSLWFVMIRLINLITNRKAYTLQDFLKEQEEKRKNVLLLPKHHFLGPGNDANRIEAPVDIDDSIAKEHDLAYHKAKSDLDITNSDTHAIHDFISDVIDTGNIHSGIGATGLGIKKGIETVIGVQYPRFYPGGRRSDIPHSRTVTDTSTPTMTKRNRDDGYESQGDPPPKKTAVGAGSDGVDLAVDTKTVSRAGGAPGTASGSSGATSDISGDRLTVARPIWSGQSSDFMFNKVHRMLGFGLATTPIVAATILNMVTNMMEIPWDKPFFYMTPQEFAQLPRGCFVKSVNISIVQRNPRVAFETSGTSTDLATFNQNKFLQIGKGLNIKTYGNNKHIVTYNATEPMIPLTIANASYSDLEAVLYGVVESTATAGFDSVVPALQFGIPYRTDNYWTLRRPGSTFAGVVDQGWPDFMHHIEEYDMTAMSGTEILNETYNFRYAPLSLPHKSAVTWATAATVLTQPGLANTDSKIMSTCSVGGLDQFAGALTKTQAVSAVMAEANHAIPAYTSGLMEQCYLWQGMHSGPHGCTVQPSIHVGVKPIPKLTSTTSAHAVETWTDVQAYYEINATMTLTGTHPQMYPFLERLNVSYDGATLRTSLNPNDISPYTNGLPLLT